MNRRAIPAFVLTPLLIVAIVVSSSACGTLANFSGGGGMFSGKAIAPVPLPYGGVATDVKWAIEKPSSIPFAAIDLCLSFVADTFTLPLVVLADIGEISEWLSGPKEIPADETVLPTVPPVDQSK